MAGPLQGIRVVELAQGIAGPMAAMQLGDAGADVIKVELPGGDFARKWGPPFVEGESAVFLGLNRNKQSMVVDLRHPEGHEVLLRLLQNADVFIIDMSPADREGFALKYGYLQQLNPKLVYCSLTPFGESGPWRDLPGCELVIQAASDYLSSLGSPSVAPVRVGADIANINAAIFAVQGIAAALFHRLRGGRGQRVSVSLLGTLLHTRGLMWSALTDPDDWGGWLLESFLKPPDQGYRTKDLPIYFQLRGVEPEQWATFLEALGMSAYADDPRFSNFGREALGPGKYAEEVRAIWEHGFKDMGWEEVSRLVQKAGGISLPLHDQAAVLSHPQTHSMGVLWKTTHPNGGDLEILGPLWTLHATPARVTKPAPFLGQHTREILSTLAFDNAHIDALYAQHAVG